MKHYTATDIKKMNTFCVTDNRYENTCTLQLYNWDDETEMETDLVYIELTQKDIRKLIKSLSLNLIMTTAEIAELCDYLRTHVQHHGMEE